MYTKILAADMATRSGTSVVIADGGRENVLAGIWAKNVPCTWFPARIDPLKGRKRWLLAQKAPGGSVCVDEGAASALVQHGKSLLPVGIVSLDGVFERGAVVSVRRRDGREVARGLAITAPHGPTAHPGAALARDMAESLGYDYGPEFIHRDKMVLIELAC